MVRSLAAGKEVADIINTVDRGHRELVTTSRAHRTGGGRTIAGRSRLERDYVKGSQV
jgi:hypothetical protein